MKASKFLSTFFTLTLILAPIFSIAQSDLEAELEAKSQEKLQLETELAKDQAKLDEVSAQKNTLNKAVNELDLTVKKLGTEVKLTELKIGETESSIRNLDNTIRTKEEKIVIFKKTIERGIQNINEQDGEPFIARVLAKGSVTEAIKETEERIKLNRQIGGAINSLLTEKERLLEDKTVRELKKEELIDYKGEVVSQKNQVDENKKKNNSPKSNKTRRGELSETRG